MCGDTRIPRDTCAGHTIPGETRIPAIPVYIVTSPRLFLYRAKDTLKRSTFGLVEKKGLAIHETHLLYLKMARVCMQKANKHPKVQVIIISAVIIITQEAYSLSGISYVRTSVPIELKLCSIY